MALSPVTAGAEGPTLASAGGSLGASSADVCHLGILATSNKGELGKAVCEKHRLRVNRTDCLFDCLSGFSSDDLLGVLLIKGHLSFWRSSAGPDDHGDVSIRGRCGEVAAYPIDVIICIHHGSMGCRH